MKRHVTARFLRVQGLIGGALSHGKVWCSRGLCGHARAQAGYCFVRWRAVICAWRACRQCPSEARWTRQKSRRIPEEKHEERARWTRSDSVKGWASCEENEGRFGLFAEAAMFPHCYEQVQDDGRSADGRLELCSVRRNGVRFQERLLQVPHPKAWGHAWRRWWWRRLR